MNVRTYALNIAHERSASQRWYRMDAFNRQCRYSGHCTDGVDNAISHIAFIIRIRIFKHRWHPHSTLYSEAVK